MEPGEACDDGNTLDCDGCSSSCQIELGYLCGDGTVNEVCGETCDDSNTVDGDGCSASCAEQAAPENLSAAATPNVPVSTDTENDGATSADPIESSVTSPYAGMVSIAETSTVDPAPSGYTFLSQQVGISFTCDSPPCPSAAAPLALAFRIDQSRIPVGQDENTITVFRNGIPVGECPGSTVASPDPCASSRVFLGDGDVEITVLTSEASEWNLGVAAQAQAIPARRLVIVDPPNPSRRKLVFVSKDRQIGTGVPGTSADPRCSSPGGGGGRLQVFGTGSSSQSIDVELPCQHWAAIGRPEDQKGYVYHDRHQEDGPCKVVLIRKGRRAKAACNGHNPAYPLPYDLTNAGEGSVGVVLTTGTARQYCAEAGGATVVHDDAKHFVARQAGAPAVCPVPP